MSELMFTTTSKVIRVVTAESMRKPIRLCLFLIALFPAIFTLSLVTKYGVDIGYADEWTFAPLFSKAHALTLTFADLFEQHNEHRYVFPKLLLILLTWLGHGNIRLQMFFSVFLCGLTSLNLWWILGRTTQLVIEKRLLFLALINLVLFSPVQSENWMWGIQFVLFLLNFFLTGAIAIAFSNLLIWKKFALCAAISLLATFSFGNGFLFWITTFPLVFVANPLTWKKKLGWTGAWGFAGAIAVAIYLIGYIKPAHHPAVAASGNPLEYLLYVTAFLGANLGKEMREESIVVPAIIGTVMLILYVGAIVFGLRRRDPILLKHTAPWLGIGGFALASAGLVSIARIGFGISQALDSRYTTFSVCMSVAVIGLAAVYRTHRPTVEREGWFRHFCSYLGIALFAALLTCVVTSFAWGVQSMKATERMRIWGKSALLFGNVVEDGIVYENYLGGWAPDVLRFANIEDSIGLLHPPLFRTKVISQLPIVAATRSLLGHIENAICTDENCEVSGWAVLPKKSRVADCVVIAYDDPNQGPIIFGVMDQVADRRFVANNFHKKFLLHCGWTVHFRRSVIPQGPQRISAYALNAMTGRLYELNSTKTLP